MHGLRAAWGNGNCHLLLGGNEVRSAWDAANWGLSLLWLAVVFVGRRLLIPIGVSE